MNTFDRAKQSMDEAGWSPTPATNYCVAGWVFRQAMDDAPPVHRRPIQDWWADVRYGFDSYRRARRGDWE